MKYSDYLQALLDFPLTKAQKKAFDDFYEKQLEISEQIIISGRKLERAANKTLGLNPKTIIVDELHEYKK
jgi:hypothetical protein